MTLPTKQQLKGVIVHLLTCARDEGRLDQLTVRIVLREVAKHYGIEEDVFRADSYKSFIKTTLHATIRSFEGTLDGDAETPGPTGDKKGKLDRSPAAGKRKRPSVHSSNAEDADASESKTPPSKKAPARSKPSKVRDNPTADKPAKSGKTSKKPESESKYKSKAIIESSDEDAAPNSGTRKSAGSPKKEKTPRKSSNLKQKQQQKVEKDDSDIEMDIAEGPGPSSSTSNPKRAAVLPKISVSNTKGIGGDPMESELSSVVDEPPTKRKKRQGKETMKLQKDEKMTRGKKEPLSKDEEMVNKLKAIVLACGMRKVWKKEFEGLDKPSQQIKRLHAILGDLGMTPRYSLEKAKAIREQRELAQELMDVQEFDKATKRRGKGLRSPPDPVESMDEDNDKSVPVQKKQNARASIMAFLQDQSEEE